MEWGIVTVNTIGLAIYLLWLAWARRPIFYTQDGILYLLPCVPFFFVYALLFASRRKD